MDTQNQTPAMMPTPTPTPPAYQAPISAAPQGQDPGHVLAIIGLVFAFVCQLIGLILSIIAFKKSKKAGFNNSLARVGIILNSVLLGLSVLLIIPLALISLVAYNGIQQRTKSAVGASVASDIIKKAEVYRAFSSSERYPTSLSDFEKLPDANLSSDDSDAITTVPITTSSDKVNVYTCGEDGLRVDYWDASLEKVVSKTTVDLTSSASCVMIQ